MDHKENYKSLEKQMSVSNQIIIFYNDMLPERVKELDYKTMHIYVS